MLKIKDTSQYLEYLDLITKIIESKNPTSHQKKALPVLQKAVKEFEMAEVKKYPAIDHLIGEFYKNSWNHN